MKIYLVRHAHAKTRANLEGIFVYNNQKNKGLTEKGKKQSENLAKKLIKLKIDRIFISEAKRTYETILPLLKLKSDIPFKKDKNLNEREFGIFSGLTGNEAKEKYPKIFAKLQDDKWNIPIPKGESFNNIAARLEFFLKMVQCESRKFQLKNILLVTHFTVIQAFLFKYGGISTKEIDSIYFGNACVSVFDFKKGLFKTIKINDSSHLDNKIIS